MIELCTCSNPAQDKLHGKGMRVWNATKDGKGRRCTVCGKTAGDAGGGKKK